MNNHNNCIANNESSENKICEENLIKLLGGNLRKKIVAELSKLGIDGEIESINCGAIVTRYNVRILKKSMSTCDLTNLENCLDNALSEDVKSIRVELDEKNIIHIETLDPRGCRFLKDAFLSVEWEKSEAKIPIIPGYQIGPTPFIIDLATAPHILIAGRGLKSSIFISIMLSLIIRNSPEKLRVILAEPGYNECELFKMIPHLMSPTVNTPQKLSVALEWLCKELKNRYRIFVETHVRNISEFNNAKKNGKILHRIVCIIYGFQKFMRSDSNKDIEKKIARITQLGRVAGIHIILITNVMTHDVLTNLVLSNFPTRIALKTVNEAESKIILGRSGAEKLNLMGDMLFLSSNDKLTRVESLFMLPEDADLVAKCMCDKSTTTNYDRTLLERVENIS